ncbi:MAG: hypothetical protein KDC88_13720 [Ignavibacteriae bacterium]|nr:hypothetical protein [Ignavibacteriota bacterium]
MKKRIKISHKTRKKVSIFLLLNFLSYNLLLAFPQKECDGVCRIEKSDKCECSMEKEMSCCYMIESNSNHDSFSTESEITHSSCNYEYLVHEHNNFVLPKTEDSKIDLNEITEINLKTENNSFQKYFISHNTISDVSPPIYLTVSSFLI